MDPQLELVLGVKGKSVFLANVLIITRGPRIFTLALLEPCILRMVATLDFHCVICSCHPS